MDWNSLSNPELMKELGLRIRAYRLRKNITQKDLAFRAGVSTLSVQNLEHGQSVNLDTLISVMRELRMLQNFDQLVPEIPVSPVDLLKLKGKSRQRSSGVRTKHKS